MNNPVINEFRAAARLINEWRDTLFYGGLVIASEYQLLHGAPLMPVCHNLLQWASSREFVRAVAWGYHQEPRLVGSNAPIVNKIHNELAACFIMGATDFVKHIQPISPTPHVVGSTVNLLFIGAGVLVARYNGMRIHDIPNLYFHPKTGMWDWPRKRGGDGGTTQTKKFLDGFKQMGRDIGRAVSPTPGYRRTIFTMPKFIPKL